MPPCCRPRRRCACPRWAKAPLATSTPAPNAAPANRSCARSAVILRTWTTRCCWTTCSRSWNCRWSPRRAQQGNIEPDIDRQFAWEILPRRRPHGHCVCAAGRLCRRSPGTDRHHRHQRRTGLGAGARAVARHAAAHCAQHPGVVAQFDGRAGGAAAGHPGGFAVEQRRRRPTPPSCWRPGGGGAGPAELLARHGTRGRPRRLRHPHGRRLRVGRHGSDVREAGQRQPAERQRRLPVPAQPPADGRAHFRGPFARTDGRPHAAPVPTLAPPDDAGSVRAC